MYPRLKVAKDLLKDDGVIFISIDDNELENLRKICDEIFGARNFVACCVRKRRDSQANLAKNISPIHEYVVIYAKNNTGEVLNKVAANIDEKDFRNPDNDPRGPYKTMPCTNKGGAVYTVTTPNGGEITEEWRFKRETYDALLADNRLVFPRGGDGKPRYKLFLSEKKKEGQLANTWLDNLASNQAATREIKDLFDDKLPFDTPKPIGLLKFCIELGSKDGDYILDFFSGSATTAHAVMELNAEIGGNRKFIMVQLPEETETTSAAYKCGFTNICQIGKHRIRKAGERIIEKLKNEQPSLFGGSGDKKLPDVGFRVLRLDSSNMQQVYYTPDKVTEQTLFEDNIKPDRTDEDLLFQAMLSLGIELSDKIEETEIAGKKVWSVSDGYLMACFDDDVNETTITEIAKLQPTYFVTRDKSMASDNVADNFEQILKEYSPSTSYRIL
jgi:adenine-specific DNA-methyltransferase